MATFIQTPSSQPLQPVNANFTLSFLQIGFDVTSVYPAKLRVLVIQSPRPPFGQLWPR